MATGKATGKSKTKAKGGSGSAGDKRGGIAKAKEAASRSASDRAGGDEPTRAATQDEGKGQGRG